MFVANHGAISYYKTVPGSGEFEPPFNHLHMHGLDVTKPIVHETEAGTGTFHPPSITVYPLKASGDVPPVRTIEGPQTRLNWPATLYVDQKHGELYVANDVDDSILVFRVSDRGNAAPIRMIQGPKTNLKNPTGIFVDSKNDELWAANMGNHSATVYPRAANGNVAPLRTIRSAPQGRGALMIGNPGAVAYDSKRKEVLVPN
jgi:DNA-binding beta-propeller fold protein YncE